MKILGISAYYHDSAAAIIEDGHVIAASQEERFTRKKHDAEFPENAIRSCLEMTSLEISDMDAIVFYDKPFLKFERILTAAVEAAPKGLPFFLRSIPVWLTEKLFLKGEIKKRLKLIGDVDYKRCPLLFSNHHLSHAASAFYCSPFEESAVLTVDGVGEYATASIGHGSGKGLHLVKELYFPHSLGLYYSSFTYFLGFKVNNGEYKVMGLAPYSHPDSPDVQRYVKLMKDNLIEIFDDGSIRLNLDYYTFQHGLRMLKDSKWEKLFGIRKREMESEIRKEHADLAQALQLVTEEAVFKMAAHAKAITGSENLCMAGGVALNCVANGKLKEMGIFRNIYVQPAAGDAGGALGAALGAYHLHFGMERTTSGDYMKGGSLGTSFSNREVFRTLEKFTGIRFEKMDEAQLLDRTCKAITTEKVIGWFQGAMEFGPRALGNRSILADARSTEMQKVVNLKIKKRESFRPFAPIMLEEEMDKYFECGDPSEYMLFVHNIKSEFRKPLPPGYNDMGLQEKLEVTRSIFPAITHTDFSSRIQTVPEHADKRILRLLHKFREHTGVGLMINTSFNVRGEPIVCRPEEAVRCFLSTEMDILVIEDYWVEKIN